MSNELKPLERSIADLIRENTTLDPATGAGGLPADIWNKSLQIEGVTLTEEQCKAYHAHRSAFLAGMNQGFGEAAFPFFKDHKDLAAASLTANILDDTAAMRLHRERSFPVPGKDEKVTVYGGTELNLSVYAAGNRGQLKTSRQALRSMYSDLAN